MDNHDVYFQFKSYYNKYPSEPAHLGDFIELTGPEEIINKIKQISVYPYGISSPLRLTAVKVIQLIHEHVGNVRVNTIGESFTLFEPRQQRQKKTISVFLRIAFAMILLFLGSALAILYFHSDVNMKEAHQAVYHFISGEKTDSPALFTVSYSIGIGAGIAIFFDVPEKLKNRNNPGPMELEMHQSEKELKEYISDQEGKKET
jgi:stage V sporulation protein AA